MLERVHVDHADLITVAESARILEIRRDSVRRHVARGCLHYVFKGLLDRREVLEYKRTRQKRNRGITVRRTSRGVIDNTGLNS